MQRKRWADFSPTQKICIIIGATIQFGLLVAGLWDLAHRTADEVRGDRRFWAGFMFVNWIGPMAYFCYGRKSCPIRCCCCGTKDPAAIEEAEGLDEISAL
jgi:hypothetical protein